MAAAHTGTAASCHRIDLIDEHDTGGVLLGLLEHIPDTGGTHADIHFHKV